MNVYWFDENSLMCWKVISVTKIDYEGGLVGQIKIKDQLSPAEAALLGWAWQFQISELSL